MWPCLQLPHTLWSRVSRGEPTPLRCRSGAALPGKVTDLTYCFDHPGATLAAPQRSAAFGLPGGEDISPHLAWTVHSMQRPNPSPLALALALTLTLTLTPDPKS